MGVQRSLVDVNYRTDRHFFYLFDMKKPRHKYLIVTREDIAKVIWHPTQHTLSISNIVLDLDNEILRKNRYGNLIDSEYQKYYKKYGSVVKNYCSKNKIRDKNPRER